MSIDEASPSDVHGGFKGALAEEIATKIDERSREELLDAFPADRPGVIEAFVSSRGTLRTWTFLHGINSGSVRTYLKSLETADPAQIGGFVDQLSQVPDSVFDDLVVSLPWLVRNEVVDNPNNLATDVIKRLHDAVVQHAGTAYDGGFLVSLQVDLRACKCQVYRTLCNIARLFERFVVQDMIVSRDRTVIPAGSCELKDKQISLQTELDAWAEDGNW